MNLYCTLTQWFGANFNKSYKGMGLNGHPAIDEKCGYGSEVKPYVGGVVSSVFTPQQPASNGYTAVYIICDTELETAEHVIGHLSEVHVSIGQEVTKDTVIGKEGNKGLVFVGDTQITPEMQAAGDTRGSHRHVQWRPVIRQKDTSQGRFVLNKNGYFRDKDGYAFKIYDWDNGFNGCVDITAPLWTRDLSWGSSGYDVYLLQKALRKEGYADFEPTGYFGSKTVLAVGRMQSARKLSPALGYFGPKSRAVYNAIYPRIK